MLAELIQEFTSPIGLWTAEERLRLLFLDNDASVHEYNPVGYLPGELHLVGDDDHRHPLLSQLPHHFQHFADQLRIERRCRLVEQHDGRLHRKRAGDGDALLLSARQPGRVFVFFGRQAYPLQQPIADALGFRPRQLLDGKQRLDDIAQSRLMGIQIELLKNHSCVAPDLPEARALLPRRHIRSHADAVHFHRTAAELLEPVETAQQRAFAGAARSEKDDDFLRRHLKIDGFQHFRSAKGFRQPVRLNHHSVRSSSLNRLWTAASRSLREWPRTECSSPSTSPLRPGKTACTHNTGRPAVERNAAARLR
ncbi:6-pyruvoyl-tetrahydropterin synthase [Paenibacillus sp. P22]|nr:6-pyruvoyl-tetrahydropterin synthase [Paenibacillus sp. P22]